MTPKIRIPELKLNVLCKAGFFYMIQKITNKIMGSQHEKDLKTMLPLLYKINQLENWAAELAPNDFPKKTAEFRARYQEGEALDKMLPEAFAMVREAARRVLGERH